MKALGLGLALAVAVALPGAARADNNVGCGLGTILWEGQDDLVIQLFAATTNGMFFQSFGISSNTFGCKRNQVIKVEHRLNMFAGANMDRLARDMAVGEGEALTTLADLMGIEEADRGSFYGLTQARFGQIYPSDEVTSGQMLANLGIAMAGDAKLARYVRA
jgi:hypothetical protein